MRNISLVSILAMAMLSSLSLKNLKSRSSIEKKMITLSCGTLIVEIENFETAKKVSQAYLGVGEDMQIKSCIRNIFVKNKNETSPIMYSAFADIANFVEVKKISQNSILISCGYSGDSKEQIKLELDKSGSVVRRTAKNVLYPRNWNQTTVYQNSDPSER